MKIFFIEIGFRLEILKHKQTADVIDEVKSELFVLEKIHNYYLVQLQRDMLSFLRFWRCFLFDVSFTKAFFDSNILR